MLEIEHAVQLGSIQASQVPTPFETMKKVAPVQDK